MAKKRNIKEIIEAGFEISGGVGGALIDIYFGGALGTVLGGASSPVITKVFKLLGREIQERQLSQREEIKIGAAFTFALIKIEDNKQFGKTIRDDDFFSNKENRRSSSEEILEGILISSQREFEELKLKYLGNLYANICFHQDVSKEYASQLIKTANSLSFRQFCLLQLLRMQSMDDRLAFKVRGLDKWQIDQLDIIAELRDLQQRGQVFIPRTFDGGNNSSSIKLETLKITGIGMFFCEMLSLEEIDEEDLNKLNDQTAILK